MDMTQLQGTIGAVTGTAAGQSHAARMNRSGGWLTASIAGRFQEAVLRGNCYGVSNVAGIQTQAGLSATTPALTLYNPLGSGKNAIIWYASAHFAVANAAAAAVWLAANTNVAAAAATGTLTTTHRNMLLGAANNPGVVPLLAATLPAAPVGVMILGMGLTGAITVETTAKQVGGWIDGAVVMSPGTCISIQTSSQSGVAGLWCSYIWEEVEV
jgi:hypothetical protein